LRWVEQAELKTELKKSHSKPIN